MLQKSTIQFLQNLQKNNHKTWMDANKKAYENAKADWEQMVGDVIKGLSKTEPALQDLLPKNCTFRMNRDVRFSKNKEPYKCNFGASIKIGGKKSPYAGYYFHVEPGASFVGGGFYMPEAPVLSKIRQEIDYDLATFKKIINNKKFTTVYTNGISTNVSLVNIPKGYAPDNAASAYLKLKSFIAVASIKNEELHDKAIGKKVIDSMAALKPFLDFLNRAVVEIE